MPQIPVIIPVIVTGLAVGSAMKSKSRSISKKRLASASLVAGVLNVGYVYLLDLFMPQSLLPTSQFAQASQLGTTSGLVFFVSSFLAGFLIVLAVLGIAMAYARTGRGEELAEIPELTSQEKSELTPG